MPRQNQKNLKGQRRVDPQQTFDFTVPRGDTVNARPLDTYVKPSEGPDADNIRKWISGIEKVTSGGVEAYVGFKKDKQKEGALAFEKGEAAPEDPGFISMPGNEDFFVGYERARGKAAAFDYKNTLMAERMKQPEWTIDDWEAKKTEVSKQFMDGHSDYYLQGFAPRAVELENQEDAEVTKTVTKQMLANLTDTTLRNARGELQSQLDGDVQPASVQQIYLSAREELSKWHTPKEASKIALSTIGMMAVEQGRPELMNFTVLADASGNSPAKNPELAEIIYRSRKAAEDEVERQTDRAIKAKKQEHDDALENYESVLVKGLVSEDPIEAEKALLDLADKGILKLSEYNTYKQAMLDLQTDKNWGKTDDFEVSNRLEALAYAGKLTQDQVLLHQGEITRKLGVHLMTLQNSVKERKRGDKSEKNPYHTEERAARNVRAQLNAKNYGGMVILKGAQEYTEKFDLEYGRLLDGFWETNGRRPRAEEAGELAAKAKETTFKDYRYDPIKKVLMPRVGDADLPKDEKQEAGSKLRGVMASKQKH